MVAIGGPVQGDNTLPYRSYPDLLKFSFACEGRFPRDASRGTLPECPLEGDKCKAITPYPICHPVPKKCGICLKDPRSHRGLTRWGVGGPGVGLGVMSVRRYDLTLFVTPFHIILVRENQTLTRESFRGCVDGIGTVGGETPPGKRDDLDT